MRGFADKIRVGGKCMSMLRLWAFFIGLFVATPLWATDCLPSQHFDPVARVCVSFAPSAVTDFTGEDAKTFCGPTCAVCRKQGRATSEDYQCIRQISAGPGTPAEAPQTGGPASAGDQECVDAMEAQVAKCEAASAKIESTCSSKAADNRADIRKAMEIGSTLGEVGGAITTANMNSTCQAYYGFAAAMQGATQAFQSDCASVRKSCYSVCDQVDKNVSSKTAACYGSRSSIQEKHADRVSEARSACSGYAGQERSANTYMERIAGNAALALTCKRSTQGEPGAVAAAVKNCSDPFTAANDLACVCRTNPRDTRCSGASTATVNPYGQMSVGSAGGATLSGGSGTNAELNTGSGLGTGGASALPPDFGKMAGPDSGSGRTPPAPPGGDLPMGSPNARSGLGDDPARGGAVAGAHNAADILTGTRGTSSAVGGPGVAGTGGTLSGGSFNGTNGTAQGMPDLRRFLPQSGDPGSLPRGLASGTVGPDGIMGPHSDLFKKVNERYNSLNTTLLPPSFLGSP